MKPQPLEELHICDGNGWKGQLTPHSEGWYFIATDEYLFSFNYFPLLSDLAYNFHIAKMVENDCCKWDVK